MPHVGFGCEFSMFQNGGDVLARAYSADERKTRKPCAWPDMTDQQQRNAQADGDARRAAACGGSGDRRDKFKFEVRRVVDRSIVPLRVFQTQTLAWPVVKFVLNDANLVGG
jgi:hypothetical protein